MTSTPTRLARSAFLLLGLGLGTAWLAGCSQSKAADDKTLRIAFYADNTTLVSVDPFQVYWIEHRVVLRNVAESLTDQDPSTGRIIPWLATSWTISPDALQYTFTLREGVTFSNGQPFDAQAVKTAFDADKAFAAASPATFGATYLQGYDHAEVVDPHTVRVVLSAPNAGFLQATSTTNLAILAPASYALTPNERSHGAIIGTGPFTLASYTPEVGIKLERRPATRGRRRVGPTAARPTSTTSTSATCPRRACATGSSCRARWTSSGRATRSSPTSTCASSRTPARRSRAAPCPARPPTCTRTPRPAGRCRTRACASRCRRRSTARATRRRSTTRTSRSSPASTTARRPTSRRAPRRWPTTPRAPPRCWTRRAGSRARTASASRTASG